MLENHLKDNITEKPEATRKVAGNVILSLIDMGLFLIGGSADLIPLTIQN